MQKTDQNLFDLISDDLLILILGYLPDNFKIQISDTSKRFKFCWEKNYKYCLIKDDKYWTFKKFYRPLKLKIIK